eukprot:GHVU01169609.1.p1 GENE.GHVU01169609.1~~GHVU01169609.1.p1  ORF type:complete len:392 (-),score=82.00 GHVU01169609.1:102-1277(-)
MPRKLNYLLYATDDFKFKLFDVDVCLVVQTTRATTFGDSITRLIPFESFPNFDTCLAYSCATQIGGVLRMPLDGDPRRSFGMQCHPGPFASIAVDREGRFAFTSGSDGGGTFQWRLHPNELQLRDQEQEEGEECVDKEDGAKATAPAQQQHHGGGGQDSSGVTDAALRPYVELLDVPAPEQYLAEMKNLFNNSELRCKTAAEQADELVLTNRVPLEEVANLMCGTGFFPSLLEAQNLHNEIERTHGKEDAPTVGFAEFVKLLVNHMHSGHDATPTVTDVEEAFRGLTAADGDGEGEALEGSTEIGSERLLQILMERGEAFTKEELEDCFCVLLGERVLPVSLQHQVDAHTFATHVLRLPKTDSDPSFATPSAEAESNARWGTTAVHQQQPQ